ncbi:MAG: heme biosynthesis protein HemY, partial [Lysobacteraceae bacterium]
ASALQLEDAAASAVETALKSHWSEDLALLYGRLPFGRLTSNTPTSRLATAESWQRAHSDSPALGITLGRLSLQQHQLSKAEGYLHRAIAQGGGGIAWEELGNTHAAQGDDARARQCYANALHVARGEPAEELPGRGIKDRIFDESVIEERSELGVPRLPS